MASRVAVEPIAGRAVVQFAAVGKTAETGKFPVLDESTTIHQLSEIDEPINRWKTCSHTFRVKNRRYLETVLNPLLSKEGAELMFRFGISSGDKASWRPWEKHTVIQYKAGFQPDDESGPLVTLKTVDSLWQMFKNERTRAHKGLISSIVANIWKEYGGSSSVIETTTVLGLSSNQAIYYQSNLSDFRFIERFLIPRASNKDGASGFRFFIKDDALRFHSPGYGSDNPKTLLYSRNSPGFNHLEVSDRLIELSALGAAGTKTLTVDPSTGETKTVTSLPSKMVRMSDSKPELENYRYFFGHIGPNLTGEEEATNQYAYVSHASEIYMTELSATKCLELRVGDVIDIAVSDETKGSSIHSGNWLINKCFHSLQDGALVTRYVATRGETNQPQDSSIFGPEGGTGKQVSGVPLQSVLKGTGNQTQTIKSGGGLILVVNSPE